jgi:recombinational DNA repair protein (RecF pathway)
MSNLQESCARCGESLVASIVSRFNLDVICMVCSDKERAHPRYAEAVAQVEDALRQGNRNFRGIGKPSDL